jgi:S1-C subfamily serine protease
MKKLLLSALLLTTAFSSQALSLKQHKDQFNNYSKEMKTYYQNSFFIRNEKGMGSGFTIENEKYIITNHHVVDYYHGYVEVTDYTGKIHLAEVKYVLPQFDLAFLVLKGETIKEDVDFDKELNFKKLKVCDREGNINDDLFGIGQTAYFSGTFSRGVITNGITFTDIMNGGYFKNHYAVYNEYFGGGRSGSAVIHAKNKCVYAVNTYSDAKNYDFGIGLSFISLKSALNELRRLEKMSNDELKAYYLEINNGKDKTDLIRLSERFSKLSDKVKETETTINQLRERGQ